MAFDPRQYFEAFTAALNVHDMDALRVLTHDEFVADSPQSGERFRGWQSWETQLREYPDVDQGIPQIEDAQVIGDAERWAISPGYTVVPLAAANKYTTVLRTQYPDGSWWRVITIVELRDEKMYRLEAFYAPELPAPLAESIAHFPHG